MKLILMSLALFFSMVAFGQTSPAINSFRNIEFLGSHDSSLDETAFGSISLGIGKDIWQLPKLSETEFIAKVKSVMKRHPEMEEIVEVFPNLNVAVVKYNYQNQLQQYVNKQVNAGSCTIAGSKAVCNVSKQNFQIGFAAFVIREVSKDPEIFAVTFDILQLEQITPDLN